MPGNPNGLPGIFIHLILCYREGLRNRRIGFDAVRDNVFRLQGDYFKFYTVKGIHLTLPPRYHRSRNYCNLLRWYSIYRTLQLQAFCSYRSTAS